MVCGKETVTSQADSLKAQEYWGLFENRDLPVFMVLNEGVFDLVMKE